jgi:hypothetical protein
MRLPAQGQDRLAPTASARVLQSERAAWPQARGVGRGRVAVRGEGVMRFWLKPGEMAVTLGPGEEQREERIPAHLLLPPVPTNAPVMALLGDELSFRLVNHLDGFFLNLLGNLN